MLKIAQALVPNRAVQAGQPRSGQLLGGGAEGQRVGTRARRRHGLHLGFCVCKITKLLLVNTGRGPNGTYIFTLCNIHTSDRT